MALRSDAEQYCSPVLRWGRPAPTGCGIAGNQVKRRTKESGSVVGCTSLRRFAALGDAITMARPCFEADDHILGIAQLTDAVAGISLAI